MDSLLCEESWPSSPITPEPLPNFHRNVHHQNMVVMSPVIDDKTVEEALVLDLMKESLFGIHGDKFLDFIVSKKLIDSRFRAIQWIIQTRSRLNLSYETVFSAANVFDRFLYMTSCDEWTNWMVELVALTSLSIASKFNEVTTPTIQELHMEGLNHMFQHKTVLEMEIIMLKALEWRVNSVTSYSFSQILVSKIGMGDVDMMMNRITQHLLDDLCDLRMLQYAPSVVAFAAMWNVPEETGARDENLCKTLDLFGQNQKEQIAKCIEVMKSPRAFSSNTCEVKTFMSILRNGGGNVWNIDGVYCGGDLSAMFQILWSESDKKRERDEYEDQIRPAKRMTMVMSI